MGNIKNQSKKNDERNRLIDIYKGICILFVIFTHYCWTDIQCKKMLFPFWIDMAVPMFMIISGYVTAMSYDRKGCTSLSQCFSFNSIFKKCLRFIVPFIIAYIIEVFLEILLKKQYSIKSIIGLFIYNGHKGAGAYYFPIMLQFIFLFPFVYVLIHRKGFIGLQILFFINGVYEFLQRIYSLNEACYRLLIFRYIYLIAFGCYLYLYQNTSIKKIWLFISLLMGGGFIVLVSYTNYIPKIIIYWTRTSFLAGLYITPIAYILLKIRSKIRIPFLELLGKASFNIFLIQMIYYLYLDKYIYNLVSSVLVRLIINISTCCILGIIFFYLEDPITKKLTTIVDTSKIHISNKIESVFITQEEN